MEPVRPHHPGPPPARPPRDSSAPAGGRLNLLLSWPLWRADSVADRLPPLLEPMGVTSLRAASAREAERVIRGSPVHIAVVDLGIPMDDAAPDSTSEEAGTRILELLRRLESPPPVVVIKRASTRRDEARELNAALRCDAFAVVDRGAADLELMLKVLQRCLHRFYRGRWPTTS